MRSCDSWPAGGSLQPRHGVIDGELGALTGIDASDPPLNLGPPCGLGVGVQISVEALDELLDESGAIRLGEGERGIE